MIDITSISNANLLNQGYIFSRLRFPLCTTSFIIARLAFIQCKTVSFASDIVCFAPASVDLAKKGRRFCFKLVRFVFFSVFLKDKMFVLRKLLFTLMSLISIMQVYFTYIFLINISILHYLKHQNVSTDVYYCGTCDDCVMNKYL